MKPEIKQCQNCKNDFTIEIDDFSFYEKIKVPAPTFCPECRLQRRLAWRNERGLHSNECGLCKKRIISIYNKDSKMNPYCDKCWWSDKSDGIDYGVDVDFSKPFLTQFFELFHKTPVPHLFSFGTTMINSEYCNMANDMKNCYLLHDGTFDENVFYGSGAFFSKDSLDITMTRKGELCYEVVTTINCYKTIYSQNCEDCIEVAFSFGLKGCQNCFGCVNLVKQSYCIWNEPYTKEEYEEKIKSFNLGVYSNILVIKEKAREFWKKFPKKYYFGVQNLNVTGDYLENSKNSKSCFGAANLEDSKFCSFVSNGPVKNGYDFTHYGDNIELINECLQSGDGISNILCGWGVWSNSNNVSYCITSPGLSYCFGCVGLKKKKYCILNKQYTKEEYEELIPKIIKHMSDIPYVDKKGNVYRYGEFFPIELSPFGYNETTAQEYFTSTKEEAFVNGYNWRDKEKRNYQIEINSEDIPNDIGKVDDSIIGKIIGCEHRGECNEQCTEAFKIIPDEFQFYKRINLPIPHLCPNCRHYQRLKQRNPLKLWHRSCMKEGCMNEFETSYAPERTDIVYCEKCYQNEVY